MVLSGAQAGPPDFPRWFKAREAAHAEGLHYVYISNVHGLEGAGITWCPHCKKTAIERDIFA
jgi:hypothetical protein